MVRSILLIVLLPLIGNLHAEKLSGQDPNTPDPIMQGYYAAPRGM